MVIEHFEVVKQAGLGIAVTLEPLADFTLDRREEGLHSRVVIAVTPAAHAAGDAGRAAYGLVVVASVALIGMMQESGAWTASGPSRAP